MESLIISSQYPNIVVKISSQLPPSIVVLKAKSPQGKVEFKTLDFTLARELSIPSPSILWKFATIKSEVFPVADVKDEKCKCGKAMGHDGDCDPVQDKAGVARRLVGEFINVATKAVEKRVEPPKGYPKERHKYAIPSEYRYPIDNRQHVRAAVSYFQSHRYRNPAQKRIAARRILRAAKHFHIDVNKESEVYRQAHK